MTTTSTQPNFTGPYKKLLTDLAELIEWLGQEHGKSFVKAGDDKVYAYGGNGYVLVLDESKWGGLIEVMSPSGAVTIKPAENGTVTVSGGTLDEKGIRKVLTDTVEGIKKHYDTRYWSTPKAS